MRHRSAAKVDLSDLRCGTALPQELLSMTDDKDTVKVISDGRARLHDTLVARLRDTLVARLRDTLVARLRDFVPRILQ